MNNLKKKYIEEVVPKMKEKFGYTNILSVPKIKKTVVNIGINVDISKDKNILEDIAKNLALITGQKPAPRQAKKAIAGFKIRQGMTLGLKVTLRGYRMYDFLSRLVNIVLPRTRDFRGLNLSCVDQSGNLNIGIKECIIFPEISQEKIKKNFGLEVSIVTDSKSKEESLELFNLLGFPIKHG
ncbi:50S ribosomal protein L5 [Patescibacteria group bacterium]|nr:50S ribosomal protein L5 [Patescibacteria group bacterium]